MTSSPKLRLGLDVGGTFTEVGERRFTAKVLTTPGAPEEGVLVALCAVTAEAGIEPREVGVIIHGTSSPPTQSLSLKAPRQRC